MRGNIRNIDIGKFINYLVRFPVISVRRRVGFFLREIGCPERELQLLRESIKGKTGFTLLDPYKKSRRGKIDKEWRVIVNR